MQEKQNLIVMQVGVHQDWNDMVANLPGCHILQTWDWAEIKKQNGWDMLPRLWKDGFGKIKAAAMILKKKIPVRGFAYQPAVLYVPRGPLMDWKDVDLSNQVLNDIQELAKKQQAIFIKMDPELVIGKGIPGSAEACESDFWPDFQKGLKKRGWRYSREQIQFKNTIFLDLSSGEDEILKVMKQKFRYNIRLSDRKGISVVHGSEDDLLQLYRLYAQTAIRDGFVIRPEEYYMQVWKKFMRGGMAVPIVAKTNGEIIAGLFLFWFGDRAWYLYGMSSEAHRDYMPNHRLQWEAIKLLSRIGCKNYDLWGAPDKFDTSDSMWGVYKFKEGLGGKVVRTMGAWDYPVWGPAYVLYTKILPKILDVMRRQGRDKMKQEVIG